jgi:hypothetical protein
MRVNTAHGHRRSRAAAVAAGSAGGLQYLTPIVPVRRDAVSSPVATNDTAQGRQMNRGATVVVSNFAVGAGSTSSPADKPATDAK